MVRPNLLGQRFGRLLVISEAGSGYQGKTKWLCRCDCSVEKIVYGTSLKSGGTKSCGCLRREVTTTHGLYGTPGYNAWFDAKLRCTNPNHKHWVDYGGRGIEFRLPDVKTFSDHIGPRPSNKHSLDRIDNDGHYEPGNIRWALRKIQNRNRRNNRLITYQNETLCVAEWSEKLGLKSQLIFSRLKRGWSVEKALGTPVKQVSRTV